MIKRLFLITIVAAVSELAFSQPAARRQAQQKQASASQTITNRAKISYPVTAEMSEDVVWRRDIYRELDLEQDANSGLYYPVEPSGSQMNLFTYMFKLIMRGELKAYEYRLDGNEVFTDSARVKPKTLLDNYHIYYEKQPDGRVKIDNSDIPSREVKGYYIKESAYLDQKSATFHTKVTALCPVMTREDDFGDGANKYPLFWVRYDDLVPFLSKQTIMTSNLNNAATMSVADYFTKNMYRGKIYKTSNMLGRPLSQYCHDEASMSKEQKRIEEELAAFEKSLWGDHSKRDSLDSIAKVQGSVKSKKAKKDKQTSSSKKSSYKSVTTSGSSSDAQLPRVTVRRQRH